MAMPAGVTTVFQPGPLAVDARHVDQSMLPSLPKPVMVVAPTNAGAYPVAVFLHGCDLGISLYEQLLKHVASHGFIAVAPQLYGVTVNLNDMKDIDATKQVTNWLAGQEGLQYVLKTIFKLDNVKPDLSRLALAGHSRGGDTAFAVALGLGDAKTQLALKFSALIGVDPVAGLSKALQVEPKVLTYKPGSLNLGMPVLVLGTGLGPKHIGGPPCAPAGVNHADFYDECKPPRYHFVAKDYGHLDMLDDNAPYYINNCLCMRNQNSTKDLARRSMGGVMVAFMRATLEDNREDLKVVLDNPGLSPAMLHPVDHDSA